MSSVEIRFEQVMVRFRQKTREFPEIAGADGVRAMIEEAINPANFFVSEALALSWQHHEQDETYWEIFRGRALDHTQTRQQRVFESWNLFESNMKDEPLLAIRFDASAGKIHVTRSILCRGWESYAEGQTIHSRETVRRNRELVGSVDLSMLTRAGDIYDELTALLFFAVVGLSRLPLTSIEAPLPAYTFGQLAYSSAERATGASIHSVANWVKDRLSEEISSQETTRHLEFAIRASRESEIEGMAGLWWDRWRRLGRNQAAMLETIRDLFNQVSLTPWTDFVAKSLKFVRTLVQLGAASLEDEVDLLCYVLRQIGRHLTAFDLVRFHHRGANYPDALLNEAITARLWSIVEESPALFRRSDDDSVGGIELKRLRRRAIRSGWLMMRQYRGHLVPDAPTSSGENARVLPDGSAAVPDSQILNVGDRQKRLFADHRWSDRPPDTVFEVLREGVLDLKEPRECQELGTALFLDRPLGFAKSPGEPDQTVLFSHVAYSATIASERGKLLQEILPELSLADLKLEPVGVRWQSQQPRSRPGVPSVQDAALVSDDFIFVRTTRRAVQEFLSQYRFESINCEELRQVVEPDRCLILPSQETPDRLEVLDARATLRLSFKLDATAGYFHRAGNELLANGLLLEMTKTARESTSRAHEPIRVLPNV